MRLRIVVAVLVVAVTSTWLWPHHRPTDEEVIRAAIAEMAAAAEDRDISTLLAHVSASYHGEGGGKDELRAELAGYLLGADAVGVALRQVEVSVEGDTAHATLRVLLLRGKSDGDTIRPDLFVGAHRFEADFRREDAWRVVGSKRRTLSIADLLP
jgi:ketosteroid isomerase-like protein